MSAGEQKWKLPPFDQKLGDTYVGKRILIGITYCDHNGKEQDYDQLHGVIHSATPEGIAVQLKGSREGSLWKMPPFLGAIGPAGPGRYTLRKTNEVVENPDLVAMWVIQAPPPKK